MGWRGGLLILLLTACHALPVAAQDALRGKRLYLDAGRLTGAGPSCVDCHGGFPGALHGIGRAAGRPRAIEYALGAVGQMAILRNRLSAQDIEDLAAYLQDPEVPSPQLRVLSQDHGNVRAIELLEFTPAKPGRPALRSTVHLQNSGRVLLTLTGDARVEGPAATRFRLVECNCLAGVQLQPGAGCVLTVEFLPDPSAGQSLLPAVLVVPHDWVGNGLHLPLVGRSWRGSAGRATKGAVRPR